MPTPLPDIRINFDNTGFTYWDHANDIHDLGFEITTLGWSTAAGIQAASTSITRSLTTPYMGVACGRLVTTATSGSGVKYIPQFTFLSGVTYRFRVYLKSISGTTSALIRIGSLGTVGDRATTTMTLTTSWAAYQVDFTPSANRSDVQVNVANNAAAIMTADIDDAEIYTVTDDVTLQCDQVHITHGINFEGGVTAGQAIITLKNDTNAYTVGTTAIVPGQKVLIRATYSGVSYGVFYGTVKRVTADPVLRKVDVTVLDPVEAWGHAVPVASSAVQQAIWTHRRDALVEAAYGGVTPYYATAALSTFEDEANIVWWGNDNALLPDILRTIDESTGTVGFIDYDPDPSIGFVYRTIARNARATQASAETIADSFTQIGWELTDDFNLTDQRVSWTNWLPDPDAILGGTAITEYPNAPFTIGAADTRVVNLSSSNPVLSDATLQITVVETGGTGSDTTAWNWRTGVVNAIAGGAAETVTSITVTGRELLPQTDTVAFSKTGVSTLRFFGSDINAEFIALPGIAFGLADWKVNHLGATAVPRLDLQVQNKFPTQVVRKLCDTLTVTTPLVTSTTYTVLIRSIDTVIDMNALQWTTTYGLEPSGIPLTGNAFILNTTQLNDAGDLLGY